MKVIAFAATALAALSTAAGAGELVINGSTTVLPIVQKGLEAFAAERPDIAVSLSGGGSGNGIKALIDGLTAIAMSSRTVKPSEAALAQARGVVPYTTAVAVDAMVPVVNRANPVQDISIDSLRAVYAGQIRNWKELGGNSAPIVVVSRDSSSGTFETWQEMVMKKQRVQPRALLQNSNGTVVQTVLSNKNAIGYVGLGYLNAQIKPLTIDGVSASVQSAKNGQWPLSRELYLLTNGQPQGQAKAFMDFMLRADKGQKCVEQTGYVPVIR